MKNKIIVSKDAGKALLNYLEEAGREYELFGPLENVAGPIKNHPDLLYCRLNEDTLFKGDASKLGPEYPEDIRYNAFSTGKYFIHDLRYTDSELLELTESLGLIQVNVRQGYAGCSIVPVDENAIITYDRGIAAKAVKAGLEVLTIESGHVLLEGYETGFIGGASGRIGDEIVFNGDLRKHPDFRAIIEFVEGRGLKVRYFPGYDLTDIGSII